MKTPINQFYRNIYTWIHSIFSNHPLMYLLVLLRRARMEIYRSSYLFHIPTSFSQSVSRALPIAAFSREEKRQNLNGAKSFAVTIKVSLAGGETNQRTRITRTANGEEMLVTCASYCNCCATPRARRRDAFDCISLSLSLSLSLPCLPPHRSPRSCRDADATRSSARHGGNRIPWIRNYFESSRPTVGLTTRT